MEMKLESVTSLLNALSWTKIIQGTIFLIIVGVAYGFWENRIVIYNSLRIGVRVESEEPIILKLSPGTRSAIDGTLSKTTGFIIGIEIVNVDFKKNIRTIAYGAYSEEKLKKEYDKFLNNRISEIPLFSARELGNQKIIDLINGEFVCQPYKETIISALVPAGAETVETVCAISIPPYYGRFSGYMNIFLSRALSSDDVIFIRQLSRDLSIRIYETDINRSARYQSN